MNMDCPQCTSSACGPVRCRFTMLSHAEFRKQRLQADIYADRMIRRAKELAEWERDLMTGAADPDLRR